MPEENKNGKLQAVADPMLTTKAGDLVPFMEFDKAYKHLGLTCAERMDGADDAAWAKLQ